MSSEKCKKYIFYNKIFLVSIILNMFTFLLSKIIFIVLENTKKKNIYSTLLCLYSLLKE